VCELGEKKYFYTTECRRVDAATGGPILPRYLHDRYSPKKLVHYHSVRSFRQDTVDLFSSPRRLCCLHLV